MNFLTIRQKITSLLPLWWFSFLLIFFSWFIIKQYWLALTNNIFLSVSYDHYFGFSILYFVMDNLTLIIHEAGHTIFGIFGWRFLTILGGTLLQLLIPFLLFIVSWRKQKLLLQQASLYWLGFSWLDTAAYAADAYYQNLPLIGNLPKSAHDFLNILSDMNILNHYEAVSWSFFSIGVSVLLLGILVPIFQYKTAEKITLDLKL